MVSSVSASRRRGSDKILISRACDECHSRKIRCDGQAPCRPCVRAESKCEYLLPRRKKGPARKPKEELRSNLKRPGVGRQSASPEVLRIAGVGEASRQDNDLKIMASIPSILNPFSPEDGSSIPSGDLFSKIPDTGSDAKDALFTSEQINFPSQPGMAEASSSFSPQNGYHTSSAYLNSLSDMSATTSHPSPMSLAIMDTTIVPVLQTFYERIYSMIPVFPPEYIFGSIPSGKHMYPLLDDRTSDPKFLALILAMAALASIHPLRDEEIYEKDSRSEQAKRLLDEACRLGWSHWSYGSSATVEQVLTAYLCFGTLSELRFTEAAGLRLKEAFALSDIVMLYRSEQIAQQQQLISRAAMGYILAITEIVSAIFRPSQATNINSRWRLLRRDSPQLGSVLSPHMRCLASLFSTIDDDVYQCWTMQCDNRHIIADGGDGRCRKLQRDHVETALRRLTDEGVLGESLGSLTEAESADVLITWQWLRNRLWTLARAHGMTTHRHPHTSEEQSDSPEHWELTPEYPVDAAVTTAKICQSLSEASMEAHGRGFAEKLYNVAGTALALMGDKDEWEEEHNRLRGGNEAERFSDSLSALQLFVSRHREGGDLGIPLWVALTKVKEKEGDPHF